LTRWRAFPWIAALAVVALAYLPTLGGDFLQDDYGLGLFTEEGRASWKEGLRYFFPSHLTRDQFLRPVPVMVGVLDLKVWGGNPFGFHLTNLLIHLAGALLVGQVAARLTRKRGAGPLATLMFGLYPGNVEAVAWIVHRMVGLTVVFYMLTLLLHTRPRWRWLAWTSMLLALLCKEPAANLPAVGFLFHFYLHRKQGSRTQFLGALKAAAPYCLVLVVYLAWKYLVFGSIVTGYGAYSTYFDYFLGEKIYQDLPMSLFRFLSPINAQVVPAWGVGLHAGFTVVCLVCLLWNIPFMDRTRFLILFGVALTLLSLLLVFPFLAVTDGLTNARHYTPPAMGLSMVVAGVVVGFSRRGRIVAVVAVVLYCLPLWKNLEPYDEAGRMARSVRAGLEKQVAAYPKGMQVLVTGVPALWKGAPVFGYSTALQGAMEPPFVYRPSGVILLATLDDASGDPDKVLLTMKGPFAVVAVEKESGSGNLGVKEVSPPVMTWTYPAPETLKLLDPVKDRAVRLPEDPRFVFRSPGTFPYYRLVFEVGGIRFPVTAARGDQVKEESDGTLVYCLSAGDVHEKQSFLDSLERVGVVGPVTWWVEGVRDYGKARSAEARSPRGRFRIVVD